MFHIYHEHNDVPPSDPSKDTKGIEYLQLDEVADEIEYLSFEGWRYQLGFALDNDSFYLLYNKPIKSK